MEEKKKKIENGAVLSLKLDFDLGITFLKVVDLNELSNDELTKGLYLTLYSFDYIVKTENEFNLNNFLNAKELVGPLKTIDIYSAIKTGNYKKVTNVPLRDYEKRIFAVRDYSTKLFTSHYEKDASIWRYYENGIPYQWFATSYEKVKHLEPSIGFTYLEIAKRISMEILHRKEYDLNEYYDLEKEENASIYYNMMFTQNFSQVPDCSKGILY